MADMYVGINGKARKIIKAYVGVNGVARAITAGYAGVGGIARSIFSGATIAMPQKGDTITLNSTEEENFEQYRFRVLSTSGSIAKLLFLNMTGSSFNAPLPITEWDSPLDGASDTLDYSASEVYIKLNDEFYSFLPLDIQSGIDEVNLLGIEIGQYKW